MYRLMTNEREAALRIGGWCVRPALEQISRHPAQEAVETLESLASRRSRPRVGRALRREAKAAVQIRRGAGP